MFQSNISKKQTRVTNILSTIRFGLYIDWEWFESHKTFLTDKTAYKTSAKNGLDIDSLADFLLAEVYLNNPELKDFIYEIL